MNKFIEFEIRRGRMINLKRSILPVTLIAALIGCSNSSQVNTLSSMVSPVKNGVEAKDVEYDTVKFTIKVPEMKQSMGTKAIARDVKYVALEVSGKGISLPISTGLIPVSSDSISSSLSVPKGSVRLLNVIAYDVAKNAIPGFVLKGGYISPNTGNTVNAFVGWRTTPAGKIIENLLNQDSALITNIGTDKIQEVVDKAIGWNGTSYSVHPSLVDSDVLTNLIKAGNTTTLPSNVINPASLKLNVRGITGESIDVFVNDPVSSRQTITSDGVQNIQIAPGEWDMGAILPVKYFGNLPKSKITVNPGQVYDLNLTVSPSQIVQNPSISSRIVEALINPEPASIIAAGSPVLTSPVAGKVTTIPSNLSEPLTFKWTQGSSVNDVYNITITLPDGNKLNVVTTDTSWKPTTEIWNTIMSTIPGTALHTLAGTVRGAEVNVKITGADKDDTKVIRNDPILEAILKVDVVPANGDIYYWSTEGGSNVMKVPANVSLMPTPYYGGATGKPCAGCHSLSHNADGQKKISVTYRSSNFNGIVILDRDTQKEQYRITNASFSAWSPNGKKLVYSTNPELGKVNLRIFDAETGEDKALAGASDPNYTETEPTWAQGGNTIAFVRYQGDGASVHGIPSKPCGIYTIPVEGGTPTPLVESDGKTLNFFPVYSPNGRWLVFVRSNQVATVHSDGKLYVVPADGGEPRFMSNASTGQTDSWPKWSPDGNWLAFSSHRGDGSQIYISRFNKGTGEEDAPFVLPGPTGTSNHIPEWTHGNGQ